MTAQSPATPVDDILEKLLKNQPQNGSYEEGLRDLRAALEAAGAIQASQWEYGYIYSSEAYPASAHAEPSVAGTRTPERWLSTMGSPYRRLKAIEAGPWVLDFSPVTIELDEAPWLRPGAAMNSHPSHNRTAQRTDTTWLFTPREGYEQAKERYGFKYAPCGRTDNHWPHGSETLPYCNGNPR